MKIKSKTAPIAAAICLIIIAAALIIYPERYIDACFKGFALWAQCVLPSLFPFMIVTMIFIKSGAAQRASRPLSKLSRGLNLPDIFAVCLLMSLCSGYPAGSRVVREFYDTGAISANDCKKLAAMCSTSGPLFIIGTVGAKCFQNKLTGALIFAAHAFSVIAVALVYSIKTKGESFNAPPLQKAKNTDNILYDCFYSAIISVCVAGGFIAFFTCVSQIAADFKLLYPLEKLISPFTGDAIARAISSGLIEATGGCALAAASGGKFAVPAAGFIITFGGVCILSQQLCYLNGAKVSAKFFVFIKFIQAVLCFLILLPFAFLQ